MSTSRPKPTALLIANNALLLLVCLAGMTPVARSFQVRLDNLLADNPGNDVTPLTMVALAGLSVVAALQFAGTFFDSRRAATAAGYICLVVAVAAIAGAPQLLMGRPLGPELSPYAIATVAGYAAVCAVANLHRGHTLAPPTASPPAPPLCATCGYDLRATPDRCPECGDVPGR